MDLKRSLGIIIKDYRKSKSFTTQELAKKMNLSVGLINNIENGKSDYFKLEILFKLMYILGIPSSALFNNILKPEDFLFSLYKQSLKDYKYPKFDFIESPELVFDITKILYQITEFISQFSNKQAALEIVSKHILENLEILNDFKALECKE
jgi:transcriptional regulator with XRE-family HTH domain